MDIDFKSMYFLLDYDIRKGIVTDNDMWIKQGDTGKGFVVSLFDRNTQVVPNTSNILRLSCLKPDGKRVWLGSTLSDGKYEFSFTNQVVSAVGDVKCELELISSGKTKKSETFTFSVRPSTSYGAVESHDIDVDTIKKGTLIALPENLSKGEVWADITESISHPVLRIKL